MILGGAGLHRSKMVKEKLKNSALSCITYRLISPNLNPIERLWKVLKEHARNNKYFSTAKEFQQSIDEFFDSTLPQIGHALDGRINDNLQTFDFT